MSDSNQKAGDGETHETYKLTEINWKHQIQKIARSQAISKHEEIEKRANAAGKNKAEAAQLYNASRASILGNLANEPNCTTEQCKSNKKADSRRRRLALIEKALASGSSSTTEAIRLRKDMDEIENMRCAKHVYLANDPSAPSDLRNNPPPGFLFATDADLAKMGLTSDMLKPEGTNFRAAAYMKDPKVWAPPDPPNPNAIIAFRGSTPAMEDWENNMMQGINSDPGFINSSNDIVNESYYKRSVTIGAAVGRTSQNVHFVGHSLGGGLASAAQGGSGGAKGKTASTYNAAGLNPKTVPRLTGDPKASAAADKIDAIRVSGEVLTRMQEKDISTRNLLDDAVGRKRNLTPAHDKAYYLEHQGKFDKAAAEENDDEFDEDEAYSNHLHSMDEVIDAMEEQKKKDELMILHSLSRIA